MHATGALRGMHATHDRVAPPAGICGVYQPRRAQAPPLVQLVADHFPAFHAAYEERFESRYGRWRPPA
jgi:hypothetical protein